MDTIWQYSIRTLLGFFVLLLLTRILGKKQLSQMTFFTYITGIALGNIAALPPTAREARNARNSI
ncbi:hypothetical protein YDYSG_58460 [Paenibacillus tyrfis]|nr:hypothetical protein YDYSG_58460 [Paenibacillus tyrfis]